MKPRYLTLRTLRRLGAGRRTAQMIFKVAGWTSYIKTPHRTYSIDYDTQKMEFRRWRWLPCNPSMRLLDLSMQLDWNHWACVHEDCGGSPCPECGGVACPHDNEGITA